jgi:hypothetical protein
VLPLEVELFTRDWTVEDRRVLNQTMQWAAAVQIVGGSRRPAYTERNRRVATLGDLLVAVWTQTSGGGTAETIAFARQAGTPIREVVLTPSPQAARIRGRGI